MTDASGNSQEVARIVVASTGETIGWASDDPPHQRSHRAAERKGEGSVTTIIQRDTVENAIADADLGYEAICDDYSGRVMYFGDRCFGLAVDSIGSAIKFLLALARNGEAELADELADNWCQDNMGYSTIVYFPRFQLEACSIRPGPCSRRLPSSKS